MNQAEALLKSLTEEVPIHDHVVTDQDSYFVINPDTRVIENASRTKNILMQYDHNSEKFTFELTRYVEGHDMTLCNRVRVHFNNVDGITNEENADVAELYDLAVCPDDESKVLCSWTITRQATQLVGTLNFLVQYECIDDAGNSVYEWHTDIYTDVEVKKGRNNAEQAVIEYSNILEQWYQRIFGAGDSVVAKVVAAGDEQCITIADKGDGYINSIDEEGQKQLEAIVLKAEETLATIPEDYTTTYNMAEEALRRKANVIELAAEGESIIIDDSSDTHLLGLKLYGKTVQDGVPTPEAPVDMVSVENPVVTIRGKNLIPFPYTDTTVTKNGITFTVNDDGSIRVSGTATNVSVFTVFQGSLPLNGVFTLSGVTNNVSPSTHYMQPYVDGVFKDAQINGGRAYEINGNLTQISLYVKNGETVNCTIYPQLEFGDRATDYEPSKPIQSLTINRTLHGVPVTSGGNYTDANGQQWICDEVDFERGVYVQRVEAKTLRGNDYEFWGIVSPGMFRCHTLKTEFLCDRFHNTKNPSIIDNGKASDLLANGQCNLRYGDSDRSYFKFSDIATQAEWLTWLAANPLNVISALATPIETPLTEEEIAYYKKLKTYYHNTTIINDHNAPMAIKYAVDTKMFVLDAVRTGLVSPEEIQNAVNEYIDQNGVQSVSDEHIREIAERVVSESDTVTDDQIASEVAKYLRENPIDTGSKLTIGTVNLLTNKWVGSASPYSQVVAIDGITEYSQVDLTPSVEQLAIFHEKDLTFVTENEDGVVTVYAIGQKPTNDYSIQVTIKEVSA